ncbi:MAG: hypothetical protein ACR2RV_16765 [Verrucomicrobiales bacterium]
MDQLIRNAGLPYSVKADKQIFETGAYEKAAASMDEYDLVLFGGVAIFAMAIIPLQHQLFRSLVETKPQLRTFPLAKAVLDAIEERAEAGPGVRLISAGAPSSQLAYADVVIIRVATGKADPKLADELTTVVREKIDDDSLVVEVHCVAELWQQITE